MTEDILSDGRSMHGKTLQTFDNERQDFDGNFTKQRTLKKRSS